MLWLWVAAGLMVLTAMAHAVVGERRLIGPILAIDDPLLAQPLARRVIRFAWHITSLLMIMTAAMTVWPGTPRDLILLNGALWLAVGLFDGMATRGQHIGWPMLTGAGAFALLGGMA